jgi:DNA-binding NtrC family response regulator
VLIVAGRDSGSDALRVLLERGGISCVAAPTPDEALAVIAAEEIGVVILETSDGRGAPSAREGMDLLRRMRGLDPELPVLVLTAATSLETAVQMVEAGASDYLVTPWEETRLRAALRNLLRLRELQIENDRLKAERMQAREGIAARFDLCGLRYESAAMHRVVAMAVQVAAADVPVMITGPSGAGKDKVAEIIQANSQRRSGPFVKVDAAALPDERLESELLGADGGTLLLDEIGTLSPAVQGKLLRVLQIGEFERVGASEARRVDVRVLAATSSDLREAIADGRFREDLFYRLSVIEIAVPALRERPEDVLPLAESFLRASSAGAERGPRTLSDAARAALLAHTWPGNVRELMDRVQRAAALTAAMGASVLTEAELGFGSGPRAAEPAPPADGGPSRDDPERRRLEQALLDSGGMVSRAALRLGLSRQALYRRMGRLGIVLERRPKV